MGFSDAPSRPSDWDPLAPEALADPVGTHAELRARCPVAWSDRTRRFWLDGPIERERWPSYGIRRLPLRFELA